jgi:ATP-dependent helicase/nuclease subunit A
LILVASITEKKWTEVWTQPVPVTSQNIADAKSFADWLALWFAQNIGSPNADPGETSLLRWHLVADAELVDVTHVNPVAAPPPESESPDALAVERLRGVLSWEYPQLAATRQKAKASVTELRRAAEELDAEAEPVFISPSIAPRMLKSKTGSSKLNASEIGTAHHKFLQHVALENMNDLPAEAARLVRENFLSAEESAALDLAALAQFWDSELGLKIRRHAQNVRRELPFTARFSPAKIAGITGQSPELGMESEFVIVQGVADLVVLWPTEIWLVDFKTDAVRADELVEKVRTYTPQLQLYAAALEQIFSDKKVTVRALHFLSLGQTERV